MVKAAQIRKFVSCTETVHLLHDQESCCRKENSLVGNEGEGEQAESGR